MLRYFLTLFLVGAWAAAQPSGITDQRYAHLARGVNLNNWFEYDGSLRVTESDVNLLKNADFTAIRLPVAPQYLLPHWAASTTIAENLRRLDAAIDLFLGNGLAVMLDFQANPEYVEYYWATPTASRELVSTWQMLASRYSTRDPELLFFEIMNEPTNAWTQAAWDSEQLPILAAIHEIAPRHTVLVSPVNFSGLEALLAMKPYRDPNVIYVLHFYNPFPFTHQGATWVNSAGIASLRNVPYPASLPDLQSLINQTTEPAQLAQLLAYQTGYWNAGRIDWDIQLAAAWARRWGVRVVVNEFGAYKTYSPPDSRVRWIHDVQSACSKYGLGWAMWDYQSGFDLVVGPPGARRIDPLLAPALDRDN